MSDSEELAPEDSIIATRARRANAGNRLKSLLENVESLEEDEFFVEMENDEEFEVVESESDGLSEDNSDEEDERGQEQQEGDQEEMGSESTTTKKRKLEGSDDENFSDSETSESDHDSEEDDAGEKELQKQQREAKRKESKKNRKRLVDLPFLKKPKQNVSSSTGGAEKQPAKKVRFKDHASTSLQLMSADRRSSRRTAAIKNKEEVLERLKESEARRAQYVAPKKQEVHKLTQEELLEEAKITEARNRASLLYYVEQEELRKQRQRAAMLAKRVQLRHFIRYTSKSTLIPPRRIFVRQPIELIMAQFGSVEPEIKKENEEDDVKDGDNESNEQEAEPADAEEEADQRSGSVIDTEEEPADVSMREDSSIIETEAKNPSDEGHLADDSLAEDGKTHTADVSREPTEEPEKDEITAKEVGAKEEGLDDESKQDGADENDTKKEAENESKKEKSDSVSLDPEKEEEEGSPATIEPTPEATYTTLYGPWLLRAKTSVSVVNLDRPDSFEMPRYEVRRTLFGRQAMNQDEPQPPRKLQCIITGQHAKYVDPATKIPYASMQAYQIIKLVKSGALNWNPSLGGGAYTGLREGARHATGVPSAFYGSEL